MLISIMVAWLIDVALLLIFFRGATKKEKEMEINMRLTRNEKDKY